MRLMFCGSDPAFGRSLISHLSHDECVVDWIPETQVPAWIAGSDVYAGILLDIGCHRPSAVALLHELARQRSDLMTFVFAESSTPAQRAALFDGGVDVVLDKPVDLMEVVSRLAGVLRRRTSSSIGDWIRLGPLRVDAATRAVYWQDRPVVLSNMEFRLLQLFLHSRGRLLCRHDLENSLYGTGRRIASNSVEVHIHNLRRKLTRDAIEAVRGVGYRLGPAIGDA